MYKRLMVILALALLASMPIQAQKKPEVLELGAGALYGYNPTYGHYGGLDIGAFIKTGAHFEAQAAFECHNPGVLSIGASVKPVLPIAFGEFFADAYVHSSFMTRYRVTDVAAALDAGYRFDYVEGRFGIMTHAFFDTAGNKNEGDENVFEPVNMLYFIQFNARPSSSRWNVSAGGANFTEFDFERSWEPMYFVHGRYDVSYHLRVLLRADFKPAGAFHLNAQPCGVTVRSGVSYRF